MVKYYTSDGYFLYESNQPPKENFSGYRIHDDKTKIWYKNGKIHREDGPAVEWRSGRKTFVIDGLVIKPPSNGAFKLYVDLLKLKGLL